jgi:hypothetical protein
MARQGDRVNPPNEVDAFLDRYRHSTLGVGLGGVIYQPMLELLDELPRPGVHDRHRHRWRHGVRAPGQQALLRGRADRDAGGKPLVRRTVHAIGSANEGGAKIEHIQSRIGRPPILAAGNSAGDRELLEWAQASRHGGLPELSRNVRGRGADHDGRTPPRLGGRQHEERLGDRLRDRLRPAGMRTVS